MIKLNTLYKYTDSRDDSNNNVGSLTFVGYQFEKKEFTIWFYPKSISSEFLWN